MSALDPIVDKVLARDPNARIDLIRRAYDFAVEIHGEDTRLSGRPLTVHLCEVSEILADMNMDEETIAAGLLHEAMEKVGTEVVKDKFGEEIATLADSFHRVVSIRYSSSTADHAEKFRRLLLSMARDVRVVIIKLADQLHNMRTLEFIRPEKREEYARETLDIYAPLANRLGIYRVKSELEDLGFKYTEPEVWAELTAKQEQGHSEMQEYIEEVKGTLTGIVDENRVDGKVYGRVKHLYSIYMKMLDQGIPFDKVYDRVAFRIICGELSECYALLGAVHSRWKPVPGRFKDYVALPKKNLYQSLHTTVIGPRGIPMEVQIRTREMHAVAEEGIAAHWRYKERGAAGGKADSVFSWLRQVVEANQEVADASEFVDHVKGDLFPDVVYVFTPTGQVMELPRGATPIDFAYAIHSQVGNRCVGAKVNDRMVTLGTELKNGDRIEIVTSKNQTPSADWLEFAKSSRAKNRIRQWIRNEQRERSIALGRDILDREFRKVSKSLSKALKEGLIDDVADRFGVNKAEEVLEAVGYGKVQARQIIEKVYPEFERVQEESTKRKPPQKKSKQGIVIKGVGDVMVRYAKCCSPLPGEPVVGFITRGHGMTVHAANCPNLKRSDESRRIDVEWGLEDSTAHPVRLKVQATDKATMLPNITTALAGFGVQVVSAQVKPLMPGKSEYQFALLVPDIDKLQKIIKAVRDLKTVESVIRVRS
ncbi:MAG: GTP pyrophosphokinase [Deltaproteobacteria bacterium]|nr:MAG: GTP pyrophosphokinase [Deltaproteobacteria bacterium]